MANTPTGFRPSQRRVYEQQYKTARMNLLLVVAMTVVNLVLLATGSDTYFLFSAYIPYVATLYGMLFCGHLPPDYYTELDGIQLFETNTFFVVMLAISIIITLLYLLFWFMSSKNRGAWLISALIFFSLDTILMLVIEGIALSAIIDILLHAYVIYSLIIGVRAYFKLKAMPTEAPVPAVNVTDGENGNSDFEGEPTADSPVLRVADTTVKHRVLAEATFGSLQICYRRVKRTNELVINGKVYDEYTAVAEMPHVIEANVSGYNVAAGLNNSRSFIAVNGTVIVEKMRWY